jgi:hypothetical protein
VVFHPENEPKRKHASLLRSRSACALGLLRNDLQLCFIASDEFTEQVFGQARLELVAPRPSGSKRLSRAAETSVTSPFHGPKLIVPTGNAVTTGIQTVDGHPWPASRTVIGDLREKSWTSWEAGDDQDRNRVSAPSDHLQHNSTENAHLKTHHLSSRQE